MLIVDNAQVSSVDQRYGDDDMKRVVEQIFKR